MATSICSHNYVYHFSKWAEAVSLRNNESSTVAATVPVDKIFTRAGLPLEILSDQGKEFDSGLIHEYVNGWKSTKSDQRV